MIELYLFVDPTCSDCAESERTIARLSKQLPCKTSYRIIPIMNLSVISGNKEAHSQLLPYKLILDYKAALFQGAKKGRKFLFALQRDILEKNMTYCDSLVYSIAKQVKLDMDMFKEDRRSKLTESTFKSDQKMISEMNISNHGNLVIFDCDSADNGLLIDKVDYHELFEICSHIIQKESQELDDKIKQTSNLRVL
ncbi:DsbA family protein [Fructilactobacillus fructivorans]|uniref:Dithiol-disulfide isomerase n=1 Tax=Fructilactobacillus fructivorans TaxID=1614 RepID=A0AAE6TWN2_9LACO|nr:DsbA family protein [Fructilactobacillus fructivorans]KRN43266.1 hypothetical protein IV48_GL000496 [Fructilactobacillus fructivorans]QFX92832.1 dithiol-disulfide isomerase [Fructilactobacillus fructivorans]RDV65576.1 dithiol-disulfide isomerase [Fructilactobacillus fructivorans]